MAVKCGALIFNARAVWDAVDDMTEALEEIEARGQQATPVEEAEEEDDEESDDDEEDDDFDEDFDFEDDDQDEDDDDPEENPPRNR